MFLVKLVKIQRKNNMDNHATLFVYLRKKPAKFKLSLDKNLSK